MVDCIEVLDFGDSSGNMFSGKTFGRRYVNLGVLIVRAVEALVFISEVVPFSQT